MKLTAIFNNNFNLFCKKINKFKESFYKKYPYSKPSIGLLTIVSGYGSLKYFLEVSSLKKDLKYREE